MRLVALDWVNFLLADVRGGLGAYVIVYLLTNAHWSQATIGAVLTVSGLTGIMLHPSIGALIDNIRGKRALLIAGTVVLSVCGLAVVWMPIIPVVLAADITMAVLGGVFAPVVAAITVGLFDRDALPARLGRNAVFDRVGNVFIAVVVGIFGTIFSQGAPFYLLPVFAALTIVAVLAIPARAIDHERARGLAAEDTGALRRPESWRVLLRSRPLVVFAAAAAVLNFANGPLLQLVAQKLALAHPGYETGLTSTAIIVTQLATIPMALLVTRANALGRKPLLIIAFAAVPLRGLLCASYDDPSWLLGVQLLDGVGAGMYEALLPLVLADMMRGTGHYSLARGVLGTIQGIGGSTGQGAAGFIVAAFGYNAAFLTLAAVALAALLLMAVAMPETRPTSRRLDQPTAGGVEPETR
ncbi:Predicted arabinose efflux permease, MFS family [Rhizobiales bacterium GAS191]|nr:Predicted arabinose efflux permease, MFS family [Rhizobiales bacterium GAS191]